MAATDIVVVLGGTGFIGSELVQQLRGKVKTVRVVSTHASSYATDEPGLEYVSADVRDRAALTQIIKGATVVQHLAREADDAFEEGIRAVAEACLENKVRRLIFASTSDALYLGDPGIIDENAGTDPASHLRNPYSRSKAKAEALLLEYQRSRGLPVVITRPALVVGRGGRVSHGGIGDWLAPTCCVGWGNGKNTLPFVLVQDVADAHARAMDAEGIEGRAFNLAGDVFLSARDYIRIAAARSLRNFRFFPRNLAWYFATLKVMGLIKRIFRKDAQPTASYRNIKSSAMLTRIDNTLAKKLLGWKPNADLEVFIREAIEANLEPIAAGDLRFAHHNASSASGESELNALRSGSS